VKPVIIHCAVCIGIRYSKDSGKIQEHSPYFFPVRIIHNLGSVMTRIILDFILFNENLDIQFGCPPRSDRVKIGKQVQVYLKERFGRLVQMTPIMLHIASDDIVRKTLSQLPALS
jgi:hypothetical protein